MSYLHCPTCRCAYNVATRSVCPRCGVQAGVPDDAAAAIVAALDQLARAMARATADDAARVWRTLDERAPPPTLLAEPPPIAALVRVPAKTSTRLRGWARAAARYAVEQIGSRRRHDEAV